MPIGDAYVAIPHERLTQLTIKRNLMKKNSLYGLAVSLLVGQLCSVSAMAASYYVDGTNGSNTNSGTFAAPFKTIQKAASVMAAGDTCYLRAGTYRETVSVSIAGSSNSPVIFQPYGSETVTISGTEALTGWVSEGTPNIYSTTMSTTLGDGDQVFIGGVMKPKSRWPNASALFPWQGSSSNPSVNWAYVDTAGYDANGQNGWFTDSALPSRSAGYWNGCAVHMLSGYGWVMASPMTVTSYSGGTTLVTNHNGCNDASVMITGTKSSPAYGGNEYYLTGKKQDLDTVGEWYYESSVLYLYATSSPTGVEVKQRNYGFNLNNSTYVTLKNLNFFACTIQSGSYAANCTFDGLRMQYLSHSEQVNPSSWGLVLGNGYVLRNSELAYDSCGLIRLVGSDIRVINNHLHDSGYNPTWTSMVQQDRWCSGVRNLISHNTMHEAGRSLLGFIGRAGIAEYNNMYNAMRLTTDGGIFYTYAEGGNTIVRNNLLHDSPGPVGHLGWPVQGIYLDSQSSNWIFHHNLIWNVPGYAMQFHARQNFIMVFNNTSWNASKGAVICDLSDGISSGSITFNNIFNGPLLDAWADSNVNYNLFYPATDPLFVSGTTTGSFLLQSGSSAVNAGVAIPGVTSNAVNAPDLGGQELGATDWTASCGYSTTPPSPDPTYVFPVMDFASKVADGSFETGALSPNWTITTGTNVSLINGSAWSDSRLRSGYYSAMFGPGTTEIKQTVTGLLPNRRYVLYGGVKMTANSSTVSLGVRNYGYAALQTSVAVDPDWQMCNQSFVTGTSSTSADIYLNVTIPSGSATPVYADDFGVILCNSDFFPQPNRMPLLLMPTVGQTSGTTVYDSTTNGRNGTITGTCSWMTGALGSALHFDGAAGSYVTTSTLSLPGAFTVNCWARGDSSTWQKYGNLARFGDAFGIMTNSGAGNLKRSWFWLLMNNGTTYSASFPAPDDFDITAWHQYTAVYTPPTAAVTGLVRYYVDGASVGGSTIPANTVMATTSAVVQFGREHAGQIAGLRIYDYALTINELNALCASDISKIVHLQFDESSGASTAWDCSGWANNGTLTNINPSTDWIASGKIKSALAFNGTNSTVTTPAMSVPASFTIACWAKNNAATYGSFAELIKKSDSFSIMTNSSARDKKSSWFWIKTSDDVSYSAVYVTPDANNPNYDLTVWHHHAGVYTPPTSTVAGSVKYYVDGVLRATGTVPAGKVIKPNTGAITAGSLYSGQLDDVRVYSRALDWSEVLELAVRVNTQPY